MKKIYKLLTCISLLLAMFTPIIKASDINAIDVEFYEDTDENSRSSTVTVGRLDLDTVYKYDTDRLESIVFAFHAPVNGYYCADTIAPDIDTVVTVTTNNGSFSDDDSGYGTAANVGFYASAGEKVMIAVTGFTAGTKYIQVRRQRFSVFTFNGDGDYGVDTTPAIATPKSWMNLYQFYSKINAKSSDFIAFDNASVRYCNSDVILFEGHGHNGNPVFMDGYIPAKEAANVKMFSGVKFVFWAMCEGASFDNMVSRSVEGGAETAIGWIDLVYVSSARKFTDQFFLEVGNTMSVKNAAASAANSFWFSDSCKDYRIVGNENLVINSASVQEKVMAYSMNKVNIDDFENDISENTYERTPLIGNGDRYYRIINGIKSNDYYDIYYDDQGNVIDMYKSENEISKNDDIPELITTFENGGNLDGNIIDYDTDYVYAKDSGKVRLIKIEYITKQTEEGYEILDQVYTDVETGQYFI